MEELKDRKAYLKAANADGVAILEGVTSWCPQCKAIEPFVEKMKTKYPEARFYTYNVEEAGDIAQELGVNSMPTFHLFKDGDVSSSVTGAKAKALEDAIKECYDGKVVEVEE